MDAKVGSLNKHLRFHDSELYAQRESNGVINVYRKAIPYPHFIMSLTDTWNASGKPVDYGVEVVIARVKAHDLWNRSDMIDELIKDYEKSYESKERDRKNNIEAFLYDFRSQFKKAFNDVNTSNLKKE